MKLTRNSLALVLLGLLAIGAALWYRQIALMRRHALARQQEQSRSPSAGEQAAKKSILESQARSLQARLAARPDDLPMHQALLLTYQQSGQIEQAMEQMRAIVRLQPRSHAARRALANAHLALKQWPQAEQAFAEMNRRWPNDPVAWQGLAASRYHQGHFEEAAMAARKAVALQPDNPSNRYLLASALLEYAMQYPQPQLHSAALNLARKEFERLTRIWPRNGDIYLRLGRICIATRDPAPAIKYMETAVALLPKRADGPLLLARAYTLSRNSPAARRVLEQGLLAHPKSADLCDALGQVLQNSGDPGSDQRALTLYQQAVQLASRNARFQERLGTVALRLNNLGLAQQALETAAQLDPNRAFPCQQLAVVYARLHDTARAAQAAKRSEILSYNAQQLSHLEAMVNTYPNNLSQRKDLADRYRFLGNLGAARNEYLMLSRLKRRTPNTRNPNLQD